MWEVMARQWRVDRTTLTCWACLESERKSELVIEG
jgi:hypothetical protein